MKIDPIKMYTVLEITTYPNGERLAKPVVDDRIFSSPDDANKFLHKRLDEKVSDYRKQYYSSSRSFKLYSVYDGGENIDGCARGAIFGNDIPTVDLYTVPTKFVFPDKSF